MRKFIFIMLSIFFVSFAAYAQDNQSKVIETNAVQPDPNRDVIIFKSGLKSDGLLEKRFPDNSYKLTNYLGTTEIVPADIHHITLKAGLKANYQDVLILRNGSSNTGYICAIVPGKKIVFYTASGKWHSYSITDVSEVKTIVTDKKVNFVKKGGSVIPYQYRTKGIAFQIGSGIDAQSTDGGHEGEFVGIPLTAGIGYMINPQWTIAAVGTYYSILTPKKEEKEKILSRGAVATDLKFTWFRKRFSPITMIGVGYSFASYDYYYRNPDWYSDVKLKNASSGSMMIDLGIGASIHTSYRTALNFMFEIKVIPAVDAVNAASDQFRPLGTTLGGKMFFTF